MIEAFGYFFPIYAKTRFSECRDRKRPSKDSSYEGLKDRAGKAGEEGGEGEGEEGQVQFRRKKLKKCGF